MAWLRVQLTEEQERICPRRADLAPEPANP